MDTFYYCALDENSKTCPKQNTCKRYTHKKGVPASEDASAKLYNIDSEQTYKRRASTVISWINWILELIE